MTAIHLHCYTHMGHHAHAGYSVPCPSREDAEVRAEHQSRANQLAVFLFEEGCWPRVFKDGVEMPMKRVAVSGEVLT